MRYAGGLYYDAMRGVVAERITDRYAIGMDTVPRNLGLADDAAAQVVQEVHRAFSVTLADAPANDCLLRSGHADENVLIALGVNFVAKDVLLFLRNEGPRLIQFQPFGADADHDPVVQFHAAEPNAQGQAANGATVDAGQACSGPDADALEVTLMCSARKFCAPACNCGFSGDFSATFWWQNFRAFGSPDLSLSLLFRHSPKRKRPPTEAASEHRECDAETGNQCCRAQ